MNQELCERIRRATNELNEKAAAANAKIRELEEFLDEVKPGVEVWIECRDPYTTLKIGYARCDGNWSIRVRSFRLPQTEKRLCEESRDVRLVASDHLEELLETIAEQLEWRKKTPPADETGGASA